MFWSNVSYCERLESVIKQKDIFKFSFVGFTANYAYKNSWLRGLIALKEWVNM